MEDPRTHAMVQYANTYDALARYLGDQEVERFNNAAEAVAFLAGQRDQLREKRAEDAKRIEQLEVQLAGCGVAALGRARGKNLVVQGDYAWSGSYEDVAQLRMRYEKFLKVLKHAATFLKWPAGPLRDAQEEIREVLRWDDLDKRAQANGEPFTL